MWARKTTFGRKKAKKFKDLLIKEGDKVLFVGEIYEYRRNDGTFDYSIRDIEEIQLLEDYTLPSDRFLFEQAINDIICNDICMFREHCNGLVCLMNGAEHQ